MSLQNKTVVVIGAAKSGQAAVRLLHALGSRVKVSEAGARSLVDDAFSSWTHKESIECEFDGHTQNFIEQSDLVILSPGVRRDALPAQWAAKKNIPVWGEIELGASICTKPIIAVTGSNGKTTVSTLIGRLINASGKKACLCGNVGTPFTEFVLRCDDYDYFVIEVSSFQLETIVAFRPQIAVFLNFTQNHLDRHADLNEYFTAKKRIFKNQNQNDFALLNAQDETVKKVSAEIAVPVRFFNENEFAAEGITNPNHLAVLAVAQILELPLDMCLRELKAFKGVEHRLEKVRLLNGVEYINDSKATTVEAGRWALESIAQPIVMIAGGRDKNLDFTSLRPLLTKKVKKAILFGEARAKLCAAFEGAVSIEQSVTLQDAVAFARQVAVPGDVVALVPMCTSYDMFKNFEERGRVFKELVEKLQ